MLYPVIIKTEKMTDDEFFRFCQLNSELRLERNHNLEIIIRSPSGSVSSLISGEAFDQLKDWNKKDNQGLVFDSSAGFTLPDNSVKSPDSSWIPKKSWHLISPEDRKKFAHICPEFIVEVKSPSDNILDLKEKMQRWILNGAVSGLLLDPESKVTWLYKADGSVEIFEGFDRSVTPGEPVPGFSLDLRKIEALLS